MRILNEYSVNKGDGSLDAKTYREIACTSGQMAGIDTSKLADGSRLTATDTGASYVFNESAQTWTQESSGGGGVGGGSGLVVAHATVIMNQIVPGENIEITLDKTFEELKAAGANSAIEIGILVDATATVPAQFYYLQPAYALSADGTDGIMYGFSMPTETGLAVMVTTDEAILMVEQRDTVDTVLVDCNLGVGADYVYPVTSINKSYYELINAGICFARFNVDGVTYTFPRAAYGYQEGANKVLFSGASGDMTLSFNNEVFDPENSTVAIG